jgi:hypothetical protein
MKGRWTGKFGGRTAMKLYFSGLVAAMLTCAPNAVFANGEQAKTPAAPPPPAEKGWNYAKWGMSPAELIAASEQTAAEAADSKGNRILGKRRLATAFGKFNYVPVSFDYYFEPKIQKLVFVRIQPLDRDTDCREFEETATERLGVSLPEDTKTELRAGTASLHSRRREWDDSVHGNIYSFSSVSFGARTPSHCQLLIKDAASITEGW